MKVDVKAKGRVHIDNSDHLFLRRQHILAGNYSGFKGDFEALGCTFEKCDFTRMRPRHVIFASGKEPTRYVECSFDKSRFKKVNAGLVRFERCSFLDIELNGFVGHAAEFVDCVFSGKIRHSTFHGRVFAYEDATARIVNEFRGNDFSAAELHDVGFVCGIDLSQQRLPSGDNYIYLPDPAVALATLREKYLQCQPSPGREAVFQILSYADKELRGGQKQLFLCKHSGVNVERSIAEAIWQDLRDISAHLTRPAQ